MYFFNIIPNTNVNPITPIGNMALLNSNISIQPWFFDGRDTPRCNAQAQIFKSDQNIIAIIWSEKKYNDQKRKLDVQYLHKITTDMLRKRYLSQVCE